MSRIDITQSDAIDAVLGVLRARLGLSETNCFEVESADEPPPLPPGGNFFLTVAADEGQFVPDEQVPGDPTTGTPGNITEEGAFIVSGFTRIQLDATGHARKLLHDEKRGLLFIKGKILSALVGIDLQTDEGQTFLRQTLYAIRATRPSAWKHPDSGISLGMIQLTFGLDMDWSLEALPWES